MTPDSFASSPKESLRDPHLPVAHLKARLGDYFVLFPAFARIIDEVLAFKAHGCFVLELIHRHSSHGVPAVQRSIKVHSENSLTDGTTDGWI